MNASLCAEQVHCTVPPHEVAADQQQRAMLTPPVAQKLNHDPLALSATVYSARNGLLYTLNAQCPEERWATDEAAFRRAADSFTILNSGVATAGFPDRL